MDLVSPVDGHLALHPSKERKAPETKRFATLGEGSSYEWYPFSSNAAPQEFQNEPFPLVGKLVKKNEKELSKTLFQANQSQILIQRFLMHRMESISYARKRSTIIEISGMIWGENFKNFNPPTPWPSANQRTCPRSTILPLETSEDLTTWIKTWCREQPLVI